MFFLLCQGVHPWLARIVFWFLQHFYWMNQNRRTAMLILVVVTTSYSVISTPVSVIIATEVGNFQMGVFLTISSLLAIPGYNLGGYLNNRFGSRVVCLFGLPFYFLNLALFLLDKSWFPYSWVSFGFINAVNYVAIDGLFRQSVDDESEGEKLSKLCEQMKREKLASAFSISAVLAYIAAGVGSFIGVWLASISREGWILLTMGLMMFAYLRVCAIKLSAPQRKAENAKREKVRFSSRFHLFAIAIPYLGIAIANTVFLTFLLLDIGMQASIILLTAKLANGYAYLQAKKWIGKWGDFVVFRQSSYVMVTGVLLIPIGKLVHVNWLSLLIYLLGGILIGLAISSAKLSLSLKLQLNAPREKKGSATAPLATVSEIGFLISPVTFGWLAAYGGYNLLWVIAAAIPAAIPALLRK